MGKTFILICVITMTISPVIGQGVITEKQAKKFLKDVIKPSKIETEKKDTCTYRTFYFDKHKDKNKNVFETKQVIKSGQMLYREEQDGVLVWRIMETKRDCQTIVGYPKLNPKYKVLIWDIKDDHGDIEEGPEYFSQKWEEYGEFE